MTNELLTNGGLSVLLTFLTSFIMNLLIFIVVLVTLFTKNPVTANKGFKLLPILLKFKKLKRLRFKKGKKKRHKI